MLFLVVVGIFVIVVVVVITSSFYYCCYYYFNVVVFIRFVVVILFMLLPLLVLFLLLLVFMFLFCCCFSNYCHNIVNSFEKFSSPILKQIAAAQLSHLFVGRLDQPNDRLTAYTDDRQADGLSWQCPCCRLLLMFVVIVSVICCCCHRYCQLNSWKISTFYYTFIHSHTHTHTHIQTEWSQRIFVLMKPDNFLISSFLQLSRQASCNRSSSSSSLFDIFHVNKIQKQWEQTIRMWVVRNFNAWNSWHFL